MKKLIASGRILILIFTMLICTLLLLMEGCARIPLNYLPNSNNKISGSLSISNFKYAPSINGKVKPYQIRNKAIGSLKFNKNIDAFFQDAVIAELNTAGIKLDNKNHGLIGEIEDFFVDELGAHADWTLIVNYSVKNLQTGKALYESTKITKRNVSKLANLSIVVNEMIKSNIEELLKDNDFLNAINN